MWLVAGSFGIAAAALVVGFAPLFVGVLAALFAMGTTDGLTIVAETGIMQRRTPDAVRSRAMAAFEAALSLGLAFAYLLAGPVLTDVGPQVTYRRRLGVGRRASCSCRCCAAARPRARRRRRVPGDRGAGADAVGEVLAGGAPRYASAEALGGERRTRESDRRTA